MMRSSYEIFSEGRIAELTLPNRLVRSATWDPSILKSRKMTKEVLHLYKELALGGVGLIITGGFPAFNQQNRKAVSDRWLLGFDETRVEGVEEMANIVHSSRSECAVIAQVENGSLDAMPSETTSPFSSKKFRELSVDEIDDIVLCYVEAIEHMKRAGFDGVQLHAAHGSLLSRFLSPYTNHRADAYGGSISNRTRIIHDIVSKARRSVGKFPILVKVNCTDYLEGGIELESFPDLAREIERIGVDALEVSGGMWDCLRRSEQELGFRPVPAPESHTRIGDPEKQSYFLKYAEVLDAAIPLILVGGNRDIERLESIINQGKVDLIALSRPLIREPDLPNRWLEGRGSQTTDCISCNSCIYSMHHFPERIVTCVHKHDKALHRTAQEWLSTWVDRVLH
ncbi:MAG: NADH:flavin oxidoreductase [Candidatus Thorarchaeota archaeon]|nr:MAG: NADH:flavin oxidoreductase [Candidatus Thorarchaeota archaeon]